MRIMWAVTVYRYVHNQDWESALRVAEDNDPESVVDVNVGQVLLLPYNDDIYRYIRL